MESTNYYSLDHELGSFELACYVWEEVFVLIICFLTIHFLQVLLGEVIRETVHHATVLVLIAPNNAHEEFGWDAEAEHAVDEDAHDFQVDESLEELAEVSTALLEQLHVQRVQLHVQFGFHLESFEVRLWVAVELLGREAVILEDFDVVGGLVFHANNGVQVVAIVVRNFEVLFAKWHYARAIHLCLVCIYLLLQFLLYEGLCLLLVFNVRVLRFNLVFLSFLPVREIVLVVLRKER